MDGLLIVDKPEGLTSHDVVARARRILREKRVGHTGTLDPFATGVLVLLVGRATRLAQFLSGDAKAYDARIRLGHATDTGDLTGRPVERDAAESASACASLTREEAETALARLRGEIEQTPPMYSAKKIEGRRLYELARRGETVERKAVRVSVYEFEILSDEGGAWLRANDDGTCDVDARVVCSAGTYVRALAESFGELTGAGAHLAALRRTRAGDFLIEQAVTLERLQALAEEGRADAALVSMKAALSRLPSAHLSEREAESARHGAPVPLAEAVAGWADGAHVSMLDGEGRLLAVGLYDESARVLRPKVGLARAEK
jgi:tRNA pseudouridine55 synthase